MIEPHEHDTLKKEAKEDYDARMLENFNDDIKPLVFEISELISKIKDIEAGYSDFDFSREIKEQVCDLV